MGRAAYAARKAVRWAVSFRRASRESGKKRRGGKKTIQAKSLILPVVQSDDQTGLRSQSLTSKSATAPRVTGWVSASLHRWWKVLGVMPRLLVSAGESRGGLRGLLEERQLTFWGSLVVAVRGWGRSCFDFPQHERPLLDSVPAFAGSFRWNNGNK